MRPNCRLDVSIEVNQAVPSDASRGTSPLQYRLTRNPCQRSLSRQSRAADGNEGSAPACVHKRSAVSPTPAGGGGPDAASDRTDPQAPAVMGLQLREWKSASRRG